MTMNNLRRAFLQKITALTALALLPLRLIAGEWNKVAFDAKTLPEALKGVGLVNAVESKDIFIKAPDVAENSAVVPIEVTCKIPDTRIISIFADKNPQPLIAQFNIAEGVEPYVSIRIKMGDTGNIRVVAQAGDKQYVATRKVEVTVGGCG